MSSREDINEQIHEMQEEGSILSFYPAEINVEDNDDPNVSEVKIELNNTVTLYSYIMNLIFKSSFFYFHHMMFIILNNQQR